MKCKTENKKLIKKIKKKTELTQVNWIDTSLILHVQLLIFEIPIHKFTFIILLDGNTSDCLFNFLAQQCKLLGAAASIIFSTQIES
jgi:hypothetical protein